MNLFQPFRAEVERLGGKVSDTLDFLTAKINALWNVQHNADGTHGAVTATGLSVPANSTTGAGTVTSDLIPATTNLYRLGGQSSEPTLPIYAWKELWSF